ncbi:unnamed protein product [Rotaria socialis]|uniref:C2H2-type domain-containing protein n=1 Tax=Rotaria socialis TaxID=392032 RepID=A0A818PYW1_9BILA|nr:unnamed protein product [Rotaria socialis]
MPEISSYERIEGCKKQLPSNPIESNKVLHICSQCTRTFKDINNFREHLFQEHGELGVNVRQCHLCSYATLLKSKYDCHIRCHLNNRVIRCQKCNYSTINIRHMSKHERQHSVSNTINTPVSNESPMREAKRARLETIDPSPDRNWSTTLYIDTQIKDEPLKTNDEQPTGFSSCFLTDQLLMPDNKKSQEKSQDTQILRSLQSFRSNSSYSTEELNCLPCTHQNSLVALRSNVWTLLRMLLPQLSFYYPSISMIDDETDHCIDRLVANLIQIPSYYGSYPSV